MATKLKTWDENLQLLLAQMRCPLKKCKPKFQYMSIMIKQEIRSMFEQVLSRCSLAVDKVVYGATALVKLSVQPDGFCPSKQCKDDVLFLKKAIQQELEACINIRSSRIRLLI
ncbi:hypothetical protein POM88_036190 [Heracleum sosnowskyi]|uniref:Uncharacterized protein n=1 Tax=Heracleum sosnowskyi TaxID=360622 RepID=A0AAD8MFD9_9APIA|nr:hypothetical protein POM88_036190 [Heracleum sosnowskyi]